MNELEQAFEEVTRQKEEKLAEMLSEGTQTEEADPSDAEETQEEAQEETQEEIRNNDTVQKNSYSEEAPDTAPAEGMVKSAQRDWEKQFTEFSEYTGKVIYGYKGLSTLPNFKEIDQLIRNGATVLQAYKLANFESIIKNEVQKERNKIRGKAHLKASRGGAGANEVVVPNDVYRAFKMLEPNMSDEDIRQYYKKTYNNLGDCKINRKND